MTSGPIEGDAGHYIRDEAATAIAAEIAEAGGAEVFFVGRRDRSGLIHEVESFAYGREDMVPAMVQRACPGEVILHNHPSGFLEPSEADIEVSSRAGDLGIGSFIVNNDCTRMRVVVRPADVQPKVLLDDAQVLESLNSGSRLAQTLGDYEDRPQQRGMALGVTAAFNDEQIAAIEAGTGTGKSLAYLLPAVLFARANKERIVISTNTINLQEQLLHKDIPAVRRALGVEFSAEIVKGRGNYVCKRKAQMARDGMETLVDSEHREELLGVLDWASKSETGDRGDLPAPPRSEVWERVESEADNCLRVRCPFYDQCFYYNSRRRAARADLLIVNHSLLLSDLAVRRESGNYTTAAVLPPFNRVILDEAHHLEEVATQHLSRQVSRLGLSRHFHRLYRYDRTQRRGALVQMLDAIEEQLKRGTITTAHPGVLKLTTELLPRVADTREMCDYLLEDFASAFLRVAGSERPVGRGEFRKRIVPQLTAMAAWEEDCLPILEGLTRELVQFVELNREIIESFGELEEKVARALSGPFLEWSAALNRVDGQRQVLRAFLNEDQGTCRWVEIGSEDRGKRMVRLCVAPVNVGEVLRESLHDRMKSEVLSSATLTVEKRFDFFLSRIGLQVPTAEPTFDPAEWEDGATIPPKEKSAAPLLLDSPFDYARQVFLGVPLDLGDPREGDFERKLSEFLARAVTASDGRAFFLFTSHAQLERVHRLAAPGIRRLGYTVFKQGEEARDRTLRKFREDETSVLFATSSFWEGVDVRGRALELLVLVRLPFTVPTDPLQEAQIEALERQGIDSFSALTVPRAIIRFKQGFGRLIRSRTDRGAVLITDSRVRTKNYGRRFMESLPVREAHYLPSEELLLRLAEFYRQPRPE